MYSFLISLVALVLGYVLYGKFVERIFGPDPARPTPAVAKADGVDFIVLPSWRVFMIQFLNIAGTGPIFGAIMGAKFGPAAYFWIVFGCIFAGAVHDYTSGMLSVRHGGIGLPELVGKYLGKTTKTVMLVFSVLLLLLVGAVFVYSPALILGDIAGNGSRAAIMIWVGVIFVYYIIATLLPIDKLIGKIYPLFAFALIFMAVALMVCLFVKWPALPEIWDGLGNRTGAATPIFPCLFITIACGAISGFHGTQSPLMARCMANEKLGRPIFYGSMITEGIVALVWATIGSWFFFGGGAAAVGSDVTAAAGELARPFRRHPRPARRRRRPDHQRRYGPPFLAPDHRGLAQILPAPDEEPPGHRHPDVRGDGRPPVVQRFPAFRLRHPLALVRLGQPDPRRVHPLDRHGLSGHDEKGPGLPRHLPPGLFHDRGHGDLHLHRENRLQPASDLEFLDRRGDLPRIDGAVLPLVEEKKRQVI